MDKIYKELFDHVKNIEIIDTHEHLPHREDARDKDTDVLKEYLTHYFNRDLISAGLRIEDFQKAINNKLPLMERWDMIEAYWDAARNTGYGRALDISANALYGIEKICRSTLEPLNDLFQKSLEPGHFKKVLKEKSKIKISLLDTDLECDKSIFRSMYRLDSFIFPRNFDEVVQIENDSGIRICSFENWLEACEKLLDKALNMGAVGLKSGLAYTRSLKYERVTRSEAERDFNKIFVSKKYGAQWEGKAFTLDKAFQNYMMHYVLALANKRNLVFQFHTGLQEGNASVISDSDPSLLSNLFIEYPDVDFDIFHIGYPYQHVVSALAKVFPNVFIDMCWAHIISPTASINALIEWLDSVPVNKISAFGGDYCFIDGVYGHQYLARVNVSKALAIKVADGVFHIDRAKEVAEMLFYKNPLKIFRLENKL